jgi:hypothetical protein
VGDATQALPREKHRTAEAGGTKEFGAGEQHRETLGQIPTHHLWLDAGLARVDDDIEVFAKMIGQAAAAGTVRCS